MKIELNENRFSLRTKILIKIKNRDKKKSTKKFHGGEGTNFLRGKFSWGGNFSGDIFPGGTFPRPCALLG